LLAEADNGRLARVADHPEHHARRGIAGWLVEIGYIVVNAGIRLDRGRTSI
jgi:hypothetical protein